MPKRWVCSQGKFLIQDWVNKIENNFTQNKYNKLQKINVKNKWFFAKNKCKSANMGSSTVQLHGVDLIDIQIQNWLWKIYFYII